MADYCTQADVEKYLNVTFTNNPEPVVSLWITAVSKTIDTYCRHDFSQHAGEVEYHDGEGKWGEQDYQNHNTLFLKKHPVISVTEIVDNGTTLTVTDDYVVYEEQTMIRLVPDSRYFTKKRKGVKVTYTYGYTSVPADVKEVCIRLVAEALKEQLRFSEAGGSNRVSIGGISVSHPEFTYLPDWAKLALKEYVQWGWS